ncbi:MAG: carboxypeptidase-like regulatory domain-containing protein [Bacteroidales bacterium]|nr:carboxypeptidase-like regulatory domain-containing protein [Bacteroidales bacterium]
MKQTLFLLFILLSLTTDVFSQAVVKGQIIDKKYKDLFGGVTIIQKGTPNGTISDVKGHYELNIPEGIININYSFLGYKTITKEINACKGDTIIINVEIEIDDEVFDEISIVNFLGYDNFRFPQRPNRSIFDPQSKSRVLIYNNNFIKYYTNDYKNMSFYGFNIQPEFNYKIHTLRYYPLFFINIASTFSNYYNKNNEHQSFNTLHLGICNYIFSNKLEYYIGYFKKDEDYSIEPFYNYDNYTVDNIEDGISIRYNGNKLQSIIELSLDEFKLLKSDWDKKITISNKTSYKILHSIYNAYFEYHYKNYSELYDLLGNESTHFSNGAIGLKINSNYNNKITSKILYIQSNNYDKNVSLTNDFGNGIYCDFQIERNKNFLNGFKIKTSYIYGKKFQTLAGHDIYSISHLGGNELSVLTEELYYSHEILTFKRTIAIMASIKNYNDLIRKTNTQTLEIGLFLHPMLQSKCGISYGNIMNGCY